MRTIKNLLATIALLFCSGTMDAYDFIVDGIYYDITSIEKLTVSVVNPANNVSIANSSPYEGDFVISSTVNFEGDIFTVTGIGRKAFFNGNITSIVLPETLRRIESEAFYSNDELNSIIIPQNLEYIGPSAFDNCKKLKEIFFVGNNYPDTEYYTGAGETYPFDRTFAHSPRV